MSAYIDDLIDRLASNNEIDDFLDEESKLIEEDLEELKALKALEEAKHNPANEKAHTSRCLACFFFRCRCQSGLANKKL